MTGAPNPEGPDDARAAYDAWHAAVGTPDEPTWHAFVKGRLPQSLDGLRVLEIGCGDGRLAVELGGRGAHVVAADFSPVAVELAEERARREGLENVEARVEDIHALPDPDASFDVVVSCETIEHVPDPPAAVNELARVLRPGGTLLLTTPNYLGPMGLYRGYLRLRGRRYTEEGQPINRFTLAPRTSWWIRRAGLDVQHSERAELHLPVPGRPLQVLDRPRALVRLFGFRSLFEARKPQR